MNGQPAKDPLHGVTLEQIVNRLVTHYGWDGLGRCIEIDCFNSNPTVKSSLKFLRKTPWARKKVENLYLDLKMDERDECSAICAAEDPKQATRTLQQQSQLGPAKKLKR